MSQPPLNSRLSVDAMCSFNWSFEQDLALWSDMGVRHAGLLISKLGDDPAARMTEVKAGGIGCSTLITECFDLCDPDSWESTRSAHRKAIDLVASVEGHSIYFTPGRTTTISWAEDLERLAEAVAPSVAYAKERDVIAAIEPSIRTSVSFITTLRDAIDAAERTGLGIVADFGNMWMERDFRETLQRAMPHVALMQIGDMIIGATGRPAPGGRAHVGEGELPLRRMMQDVLDAGYAGVFDLEVVPANFAQGYDEETLRRGITAASALLDSMGL
ncbi:MAG: sugar phosphate isomerase/epimerase family protein [Pigmentiphaga sp.]